MANENVPTMASSASTSDDQGAVATHASPSPDEQLKAAQDEAAYWKAANEEAIAVIKVLCSGMDSMRIMALSKFRAVAP